MDEQRGKESSIAELKLTANFRWDWLADKRKLYLLFIYKCHVYERFAANYTCLFDRAPPTKAYFTRVWHNHCHKIKIWKGKRFACGVVCNELDRSLKMTTGSYLDVKNLKVCKIEYVKWWCLRKPKKNKKIPHFFQKRTTR